MSDKWGMRLMTRWTSSVLVILAMAVVPATADTTKKSAVRPVVAYTLSGCETCASLKSRLRREGVKLHVTHTDKHEYDLYPTVIYSDGRSDHGDRIFRGRCTLPKSLRVYETD